MEKKNRKSKAPSSQQTKKAVHIYVPSNNLSQFIFDSRLQEFTKTKCFETTSLNQRQN